ncbi:transcription factor jumonji, JmjC [Sphingobium lactosutens]|uniref:cupin-like domain-containing protein n=1 Tax=Sphingobium lactosutens TaxID=522773 RepID=UPI0015BCF77D|nr:cupin-like domain-containing protein [Sphingobium lactosutens]NWK98982.1 transcription factor jumonji, JmjC [Sphingobium lactosutens]
MTFLASSSLGPFASAYPQSPAMLRHSLMDQPLLSIEALAKAALELPPEYVERRISNAPNGGEFAMDRSDDADAASVIRAIHTSGNWVMLRFVEQLPAYRALLDRVMNEIGPAIFPATGPSLTVRGFIFISSPGTLTPFHFDCEYNILFQIAGEKHFATYPPMAPWLPLDRHEAYYGAGDNMLPWNDAYEAEANIHTLRPGDALFIPYASPHWVKAGAEPTISLSITWQSAWSQSVGAAMQINPLLRRCGLPAGDLPAWPKTPKWRSLGCRVARKVGLL